VDEITAETGRALPVATVVAGEGEALLKTPFRHFGPFGAGALMFFRVDVVSDWLGGDGGDGGVRIWKHISGEVKN
jgi:hypothetical protein